MMYQLLERNQVSHWQIEVVPKNSRTKLKHDGKGGCVITLECLSSMFHMFPSQLANQKVSWPDVRLLERGVGGCPQGIRCTFMAYSQPLVERCTVVEIASHQQVLFLGLSSIAESTWGQFQSTPGHTWVLGRS